MFEDSRDSLKVVIKNLVEVVKVTYTRIDLPEDLGLERGQARVLKTFMRNSTELPNSRGIDTLIHGGLKA